MPPRSYRRSPRRATSARRQRRDNLPRWHRCHISTNTAAPAAWSARRSPPSLKVGPSHIHRMARTSIATARVALAYQRQHRLPAEGQLASPMLVRSHREAVVQTRGRRPTATICVAGGRERSLPVRAPEPHRVSRRARSHRHRPADHLRPAASPLSRSSVSPAGVAAAGSRRRSLARGTRGSASSVVRQNPQRATKRLLGAAGACRNAARSS